MKKHRIILAGLALAATAAPAAAELNMTDGLWETVVTISIRGGAFPVPAIKSSRCLTRADPIPNAQANMRCRVSDQRVEGNDVSWRVQSSDDKALIEGSGKVSYAGVKFNGVLKMIDTHEGAEPPALDALVQGERDAAAGIAGVRMIFGPARPCLGARDFVEIIVIAAVGEQRSDADALAPRAAAAAVAGLVFDIGREHPALILELAPVHR